MEKSTYQEPMLIESFSKETIQAYDETYNFYAGAEFDKTHTKRFVLWRRWKANPTMITFIGLNPSTANETKNDNTIKRVIRFAKDWGFGGVYMVNLYPYVTQYPSELFKRNKYAQRWKHRNTRAINLAAKDSLDVVFAWGNFKLPDDRAERLKKQFPAAKCLARNMNMSPQHPLFVPRGTKPIYYDHNL